MYQLVTEHKQLKNRLKIWNRGKFANIYQEVDKAREQLKKAHQLETEPLNQPCIEEKRRARNTLFSAPDTKNKLQ